ncbi:cysteine and tyrosine-rich protein 1-like isoform X2 [Biomphalaria glabrata]|nr:cysteine and tyrosine-rich protein 1-like isoform X2 [Biomphalaria glabrata]
MSPYTIAGIVFGVIAFICTIVAIVFCICQYKKQKSQVVAQRIFVVNGHNSQATGYSPAYPLSPGYSPHYGMYNVPPPSYNSFNSHSKQPVAPPPYNHPASTAPLPPPPAYSPPPQNPFAKAAAEANASRH